MQGGHNIESDKEKDAVLSNGNSLMNRKSYDSTSTPHDASPAATGGLRYHLSVVAV